MGEAFGRRPNKGSDRELCGGGIVGKGFKKRFEVGDLRPGRGRRSHIELEGGESPSKKTKKGRK